MFNFIKSGFQKIKSSLSLGKKLRSLFAKTKLDDDVIEELEQLLIESDFGVETTHEMIEALKDHATRNKIENPENFILFLKERALEQLKKLEKALILNKDGSPKIILVVGVNGNGKTTTTAKLAAYFQKQNRDILMCAADTFRAAATEQIEKHATRLHLDLIKGHAKSDPSSVLFDCLTSAYAKQRDIVLVDTAGRLQTKTHLMNELSKMKRICHKFSTEAPHETILVIDATTGQNALDQAATFHQHTPLTGLILTKMDGSAKGGIVLAIQKKLNLPIYFLGTGEGIDDLQPFQADLFIDDLFND